MIEGINNLNKAEEPIGPEDQCFNSKTETNIDDFETSKKKRKISFVILDQCLDNPITDGWAEVYIS
jgi:hypothetical protein